MKVRFLEFTLDAEAGRLSGPEGEVRLRPQAYRMLEVPAESAPKILSQEELLDRVWGVEHLSPASVKQAISEVRQALGDDPARPRIIETVHRRGYRFIAPLAPLPPLPPITEVKEPGPAEAPAAPFEARAEGVEAPPEAAPIGPRPVAEAAAPPPRPRRRFLLHAVGLAGFAAVSLLEGSMPPSAGRSAASPSRAERAAGRPTLAILGFRNLSARPEDGWISAALSETLRFELTTPGTVRLIPAENVVRMQRELGVAEGAAADAGLARIGDNLGTRLVVGGSYLVSPAAGGTVVTINGTGFAPSAIVKFGDNQAFTTSITETQIIATAPAGAATVNVSVTVNTNVTASGPQTQYQYDGPAITGITPNAGPPAGGTAIVIKGSNFTSASVVLVGNVVVTPIFVDTTTLNAVTPAQNAGAYQVRVRTGSGTSPDTPDALFTYTSGPIIDAVNPDNGPTTGGTIVVVTGKNFAAPLTINFGSVPATSFNINSATQITVLSPSSATAGPTDIRVTKGADVSPVNPKAKFTYVASTPKITQVAPNSGSTFGGTEITITGLGLSGATCPGAVKFGAVTAQVCTVVNDTTITVTSPPNLAGPTVISITTVNGTSDIVPNFTYVSPTGPGGGTAPPAPGPGGTTTYTLHARWTLLTWTGNPGVNVSDAVRGSGVPGAADLSFRISAVYLWDAATATWKAYFTGAEGIPGATDFTQFTPGAVYWVAIQGTGQVPWVVMAPP